MRFIFPVYTLCRGGAQRMLTELANRLATIGHEVIVVMPKYGVVEYELKASLIQTGDDTLLAHHIPAGDVIVSNFYTTAYPAQQASEEGKGLHIRLSLCYEPTFLQDNQYSFPSYNLTPNLLVLSRWQQDVILLNHGIKGRIIPVGVNSFFHNMNIREHLNMPLNITSIYRKEEGDFSWHREQKYLLSQLDIVKALYPDVVINLVTPPGEYADSKDIQQLQASGKYRLYTPVNDEELRFHYNQTDIYVSSGSYDSGSLPGLEAMRCGAALVTSYSGGNTEYAVHERNCLMSYRYENRLAQDIIRLIQDPALRHKLAVRGEQDSYAFTWERSYSEFERVVNDIVSRSLLK
ncbi:glycosyltransferase family 4 protein [Paenibacillus urinalis]|uniref:Glycosyltransferase family 4 protein n=1 Tax=Paenibacillus urinalis TaxID=521520 RepID=A0AAX3MX86_9BACL|nr:glycosyltransferase family 4 protein [Paenibacillus urinalis]WDH81872.1 glycosyltransferase family 4 protein [Paenibacillus urinalis]